jgi:hypothetical protein
MPQNLNQILWGEGVAFIDGVELFEIQELAINFGLESISAPKGDGGGNIVIPTSQPVTGRAGFLGSNASVIAALTGGSITSGATRKRKRSEELSVSSNTVTASETPITNSMRVIEKGASKQPLKQVSGAPSSADEYQVSGTTITFNTGTFADTTVIEVSYIYADAADGETLSFNPTDLPSSFELQGALRTKELFTDVKGDLAILAAKCERTGEFGLGGAVGNISTPGFDFSIRIDNDGDLQLFFP